MLEISNLEVGGFEQAIRGMRNHLNLWGKPDSFIGLSDYTLMRKLWKAGIDPRKYMRMIVVYLDILAPLYWWKEFDTYKVGTVTTCYSTMHEIHAKKFELSDFSHEYLYGPEDVMWGDPVAASYLEATVEALNFYREVYILSKDKRDWWQLIQLLPASYNKKRTAMLNYEVLAHIYKSRKNHKLFEWTIFCNWIESLPYSEFITGDFKDKE